LLDADIISQYNSLYKAETGVSKPPITNGLTHIHISAEDPYGTQKVKEKIKIAQELGIAYDPDIDALGDHNVEDKNVIMRVKPLGTDQFTEVRIESVDVPVEIVEEM
jgi:TATA-binding protein-associated factor Taf7